MKKSNASQGQSASELISKRIAELRDWRGETLGRMRGRPQQFWQVETFEESEVLRDTAPEQVPGTAILHTCARTIARAVERALQHLSARVAARW